MIKPKVALVARVIVTVQWGVLQGKFIAHKEWTCDMGTSVLWRWCGRGGIVTNLL